MPYTRRMDSPPRSTRSFRVEDDLWADFDWHATAIGTDPSDLLRMLIRWHLQLAGPPPRPAVKRPTADPEAAAP